MNRLVISVPVDIPESQDPVRLGALYLQGHDGGGVVWVASGEQGVLAFVALAELLKDDVRQPTAVRHIAAGAVAALGIDVPTDPGPAPGRLHPGRCVCVACEEWRRGG